MRKILIFCVLALLPAVAVTDVVLTIPEQVKAEVGGTATVNYDRIRTTSITVEPQNNTIEMRFELFVSTDAAMPAYVGTYVIDAAAQTASIRIDRLGFEAGITLTTPQTNSVINNINAHVQNVENSMITFGVVDGTQQ